MKKFTLDINDITDDFFTDTRLLGIVVSSKNYRFCWQVNNVLGYNFRMEPELEIQLKKKGRDYFFRVYHYIEDGSFLDQYIYHNQHEGEYLLPEFRHIDFLWLLKGDKVGDEQCRQLIQSVKGIPGVQLVTELTNEQIKNKGNLVI